MSTIELRLRRPSDGTTDTDLFDVKPLRESFSRFASGATLPILDRDGATLDDYPYGTRVQVQYSTDAGSTWTTRLEGLVADATRSTRTDIPMVEVELVAYDHLLRRRKVYKSYNDTISNILNDLITSFTSVSWVSSNVSVTNNQTINREFKGERVDEAIKYLASESADEEWGVNDSLEFFFRSQDDTRAPAATDADVIRYDLPTKGKRSVNRYKLFYGSSGSSYVTREDREQQQALKDKLGTGSRVVISDSDTLPEITDEDRAAGIAEQRLGEQSVIQTGTVTVPFGRFGTTAGDVVELSIGDAGITATDFRVAQIEYDWGRAETTLTVAENSAGNMDSLLIGLSDSVDNVRARDADSSATGTEYLDLQSGVQLSTNASLTTKQHGSGGFVLGQSELGQGTSDQLGGGVASSSSITVESKKAGSALLNLLRDLWQDGNSESADLTHVGVGTDDAAATRADTSLQAAVDREAVDKYGAGNSAQKIEFVATIPAGGPYADAASLKELMVFDADTGGTGYLRVTHADTSLDASTRLKVHVEVDVQNDPDGQGVITSKGQERIRDLAIGESDHEPSDRVYGTGTSAPSESDTSLGSQSHEDAIDSTADRSTGIASVVERITAGDADTTNFSELGEENAADELLSRVVFEAYGSDVVVESDHRFRARNA